MKLLIRRRRKENSKPERSIFNAIHAVHLDPFPGYKREGEAHSFPEKFRQD